MASLKEIRIRIASVNSTKKITSAMKMISAAKFKKAQDNLARFKFFFEENRQIIERILKSSKTNNPICQERKEKKNIGIVIITSNSSMCGAFNQNIIKKGISLYLDVERKHPKSKIEFLCIGRKGYDFFSKKGFLATQLNTHILEKPEISLTRESIDRILDKYLKQEYDLVYLVYNSFKNAAVQIPIAERIFPFIVKIEEDFKSDIDIIEPDSATFIKEVLPTFILYKFHFAITDSLTAEHGARMTAMHQATDNATDLIRDLTLQYNKARQASITKEILEIVSGANALKG